MIFFQSHQIEIFRNRPLGNNKYGYSATYTSYYADIQPEEVERGDMGVGRITKSWTAYVDSTIEVKEGDIIVSGGKRYGVKQVSLWAGAGLLDHKELTLESRDA